MSNSPSRTAAPTNFTRPTDGIQLPKGQCRYILMNPKYNGHRCECAAFSRNQAVPGATCHCGHLSTFHLAMADGPTPGKNRYEIELVKNRVQLLEDSIEREHHERLCSLASRISHVEESVERNQDEALKEIRGSYRNLHAAWQLVEQLEKRVKQMEVLYRDQNERLERAGKDLHELRNRNLELMDRDDSLEERIETLETPTEPQPPSHRRRHASIGFPVSAPTPTPALAEVPAEVPAAVSGPGPGPAPPAVAGDEPLSPKPMHSTATKVTLARLVSPGAWTVHVSLLPSKEQPFPFERDTPSYKRCLSRGLHRMVAVEATDANSFLDAVSRSFGTILGGRPWMPLQAKICDAQKLQGLPMLRPLDQNLLEANHDAEFLREHCAIRDDKGKMEAIYIALRDEALPWDFLRKCPVFVEGLESSWDYEHPNAKVKTEPKATSTSNNKIPAEVMPSRPSTPYLPCPVKRSASEMACSPGFDECEGSRKRPMGTCKSSLLEVRCPINTA